MGILTGQGFPATRGAALLSWGDSGQVGSGTLSDDGGGGGTASFTWGGTVACRIDPLVGREGIAGERISDRATHLLSLPAGTSITTASRFRIAGQQYEVVAVRSATDEPARFAEVVAIS